MKSNFKKLAVVAGMAMAAGSMSAQAVITSVASPAQLVPLFYFNNTSGNAIDTTVRIFAPKSVGSDTVINLLGGSLVSATSLSAQSSGFNVSSNTKTVLHYFVLDQSSVEVVNGPITFTPDDESYYTASTINPGVLASGTPYYLVLTNQTAINGGAPVVQFGADAWITSTANTALNTLGTSTAIPVLGLADTVDTVAYPTPTNNVVEARSLTVATTGSVIASPINTGIRTGSTTAGLNFRVVDVPVFLASQPGVVSTADASAASPAVGTGYVNTLVAWSDRNVTQTGFGPTYSKNGLSGTLDGYDFDENGGSLGVFSFPKQLNIVALGYSTDRATPTAVNAIGILDKYTIDINAANNIGSAANDGFLKLTIDAVPVPAGASSQPGAYSSVVLFNVPVGNVTAPAVNTNTFTNLGFKTTKTAESIFALDNGFYSTN